jgi:hypothetical protein
MNRSFLALILVAMPLACTGCRSLYYKTMEQFGVHKRDILVDRVKEARDSQQKTKEQFKSALEQFGSVVNFKGGDLQKTYDKLNAEFERCQARAQEVHDRIESVDSVSKALFAEWKGELSQYSSAELRRASEQEMKQTQKQSAQLIAAMRAAEGKIEPVLTVFRDHVLFLKHNLNARAVASLQTELTNVETNVAALVRDMEKAINEADAFIQSMAK